MKKVKFFEKTNSGIKIAEYDLQRRGPGEVFGTRQHGFLNLKIASLADLDLIEKSRQAVIHFLRNHSLKSVANLKTRFKDYKLTQISRD